MISMGENCKDAGASQKPGAVSAFLRSFGALIFSL